MKESLANGRTGPQDKMLLTTPAKRNRVLFRRDESAALGLLPVSQGATEGHPGQAESPQSAAKARLENTGEILRKLLICPPGSLRRLVQK